MQAAEALPVPAGAVVRVPAERRRLNRREDPRRVRALCCRPRLGGPGHRRRVHCSRRRPLPAAKKFRRRRRRHSRPTGGARPRHVDVEEATSAQGQRSHHCCRLAHPKSGFQFSFTKVKNL